MANDHKDYSGTPLPRKLGIGERSRVLLVDPPAGFNRLLAPLPAGSTFLKKAAKPIHVAVLFATERAELIRWFDTIATSLDTAGRLWVAWPKKASKVPTDIDFGFAQGIGLDAGLVDNKSAAVDGDWQAVRFVYRRSDRPR